MSKKKTNKQVHDDSVSLNKYISDTGFCSRREADDYILQARVTINDELALSGNRVFAGDVVEVDGEPLVKKGKTVYIALNKPEGVTSTTDEKDKSNIVSYVNYKQRIFPIGRLDKDSEGLIFLTNDGNIVNKILRAGNLHEKEYLVTVDKNITPEFLKQMSEGVKILRTTTDPCKVKAEGKTVFRITLLQGLNRQIRRMCEELDYKVKRLIRLRIMNVHLGNLPVGGWRFLTGEEMTMIQKMVSESSQTEDASVKKVAPKKSRPERNSDSEKQVDAKSDFKGKKFTRGKETEKPAGRNSKNTKTEKPLKKGGKTVEVKGKPSAAAKPAGKGSPQPHVRTKPKRVKPKFDKTTIVEKEFNEDGTLKVAKKTGYKDFRKSGRKGK